MGVYKGGRKGDDKYFLGHKFQEQYVAVLIINMAEITNKWVVRHYIQRMTTIYTQLAVVRYA